VDTVYVKQTFNQIENDGIEIRCQTAQLYCGTSGSAASTPSDRHCRLVTEYSLAKMGLSDIHTTKASSGRLYICSRTTNDLCD